MRRPQSPQSGFILFTAVVFLAVLTIIVLSLFNVTTSEEKIARNFRDANLAMQAAEAALRDAEIRVAGTYKWPLKPLTSTQFSGSCDKGLCDGRFRLSTDPQIDQVDFWDTTGVGAKSAKIGSGSTVDTRTGTPPISGIPDAPLLGRDYQPRYIVELLPASTVGGNPDDAADTSHQFVVRITAQGRGRFPNTRVVLQEIYLPSSWVK